MRYWMLFVITCLTCSPSWSAEREIIEESLYYQYQAKIQLEQKQILAPGFTAMEQKLFVDALEDMLHEGSEVALTKLSHVDAFLYHLAEKLRLEILKIKHRKISFLSKSLMNEVTSELKKPESDVRIIYILAAYESILLDAGYSDLIKLAQKHPEYADVAENGDSITQATPEIISDLFYHSPDLITYMNGEYLESVKIFMFCRSNRIYPCLMVMRGLDGEVIRNQDGTLWTQKSLASSKAGIPSYSRNGNTPAGILTIDSVMPTADQQLLFGKYRRIILNFVPKSKNEALSLQLLPESSHSNEWWRSAVTARDIGRNLLRIHGSGKINPDPLTPYYPFMRTSGCIAQRENTYEGVTYQDQRRLLDSIMSALNLAAVYKNEINVKGILYLIDIDDVNSTVEIEDLHGLGIK